MKTRSVLALAAIMGLLAASQSALAATPKIDARAQALVAALQAVSPDPLGGRLGLAVAAANVPAIAKDSDRYQVATQTTRAEYERRAYIIWKSSQKS